MFNKCLSFEGRKGASKQDPSLKSTSAGFLLKSYMSAGWLAMSLSLSYVQPLPPTPKPPRSLLSGDQEWKHCGRGIWLHLMHRPPSTTELFSLLYRKPAHHKEPDLASPLLAHEAGEPGGSSGQEPGY